MGAGTDRPSWGSSEGSHASAQDRLHNSHKTPPLGPAPMVTKARTTLYHQWASCLTFQRLET